jgi:HK97 family phage major capsid protein
MGDILETLAQRFDAYHGQVEGMASTIRELETRLSQTETRIARPGAFGGAALASPWRSQGAEGLKQFLRLGTKALNSGAGQDGGFAIAEELYPSIVDQMIPSNPMRQICRVVRASSSDYKLVIGRRGSTSGWIAEGAARTETNTPLMGEVAPTFGTVYAYPQGTEESFHAANFDLEQWLQLNVADELGTQENLAFTTGNGTNRPTGFLSGPTPVVTGDATRAFGTLQYTPSGAAADFAASNPSDALLAMLYSLAAPYRQGASWLMNSNTASRIRRFKNAQGDYLWQPSAALGQPESLMGYPVLVNEAMPDVAANAFPLAFGHFERGYLIADLMDLRITRDEITSPGLLKFHVRKRVGGRIADSNAIKLLRISTT